MKWLSSDSKFKISNFKLRLALLQPQFAPNLYDLASMLKADRVIWQDVEKWSRKSRCHRAKVRTEEGTQWINIPIKTEDKGKAINEVRIDHSEEWVEPFWNGILHNYSTAVYFDHYQNELFADLQKAAKAKKLIDFNFYFFDRIMIYLEIDIEYELAGNLENYSEDPDQLKKNLGAEVLYQEYDARNYQRQSNREIPRALENHPKYRQAFDGFEEECCVLDLLLNEGAESFRVIDSMG